MSAIACAGRRWARTAPGRGFRNALDVGCSERRFCRIMQRAGIRTRELDPAGNHRLGCAETIDSDASYDLVVSYLSLIDMPIPARPSRR